MPHAALGPQESIAASQESALSLVDLRVDDVYGARLGRVSAVLVDRESGAVQWLQLRMTGLHVEHLAIPLVGLAAGAGHLYVPYERAQLLRGPRVPESGTLTSRLERQLHQYFGLEQSTAGAALSSWERRATSSKLIAPGDWMPAPRGDVTWMLGGTAEAPEPRAVGSTEPERRRSILGRAELDQAQSRAS